MSDQLWGSLILILNVIKHVYTNPHMASALDFTMSWDLRNSHFGETMPSRRDYWVSYFDQKYSLWWEYCTAVYGQNLSQTSLNVFSNVHNSTLQSDNHNALHIIFWTVLEVKDWFRINNCAQNLSTILNYGTTMQVQPLKLSALHKLPVLKSYPLLLQDGFILRGGKAYHHHL